MNLNAKKLIVAVLAFLFLAALLIVAWVEGLKQRVTAGAPPALVGISRSCYDCHKEKSPGITAQWAESRHAQSGVGCYDCHQAKEGEKDAWTHEGHLISTLVTPQDCGRCHPKIATEFQSSHHAKAGQILGSLDNVLGEIIEGVPAAQAGCLQCHGSTIAFQKSADGSVKRDKHGKPLLDPGTWPNTGIGRINPDGSIGTCAACHSRHRFSIEMARRPDNCGKCHLGPDHPQREIYEESKHGIAFVTADQQGKMNLSAQPWVVGKDYSAAPTCATCHMSATRNQPVTHDPGKRISWTLRPIVSKKLENWEKRRNLMKDVCLTCHSTDWVDGHYSQYDAAVNLYNDKFAKPSKALMDLLLKEGLRTKVPFDEKIEWTFFYLWHHEGRRARMGAAMMAPDYTQWHGFYEVADRFYMHLLPEAEELAKKAKNKKVLAKIKEIKDSEPHRWQKGLNPEKAKQLREFYRKRYGQK